jgi:hydrogenase nickel incorporation protein HypA/HybF
VHELPIIGEVVKVALRHAEQNQAQKITKVHLAVGDLSDLVGEWVHHFFAFLTKDTIARDATLVIEHVPIRVMCEPCKKPFVVDKQEMSFHCPDCGEKGSELLQGQGFKVKSIEIL